MGGELIRNEGFLAAPRMINAEVFELLDHAHVRRAQVDEVRFLVAVGTGLGVLDPTLHTRRAKDLITAACTLNWLFFRCDYTVTYPARYIILDLLSEQTRRIDPLL